MDLSVVLTNTATGRKTIFANAETLPDVGIEVTVPLVPEQTYLVEVVAEQAGIGMRPMPFYPYTYDIASEDYIANAESALGVYVRFVKYFSTYGTVHSGNDQYLNV